MGARTHTWMHALDIFGGTWMGWKVRERRAPRLYTGFEGGKEGLEGAHFLFERRSVTGYGVPSINASACSKKDAAMIDAGTAFEF